MTARRRLLVGCVSGLVSLAGSVSAFVFFVQPWRSCPYDDAPAACAALPQDVAGLLLSLAVAVMAAVFTGWAVLVAGPARPEPVQPPAGRRGHAVRDPLETPPAD